MIRLGLKGETGKPGKTSVLWQDAYVKILQDYHRKPVIEPDLQHNELEKLHIQFGAHRSKIGHNPCPSWKLRNAGGKAKGLTREGNTLYCPFFR